jgi:Excalibur calcium-binding domain
MSRRTRREHVIVHVSGDAAATHLECQRRHSRRRWAAIIVGVALLALMGRCAAPDAERAAATERHAHAATAPAVPAPAPESAPSTSLAVPQAPAPVVHAEPAAPAPAAPFYVSCTDVRDAGAAPLSAGSPGYRPALDRDHDGIACDTEGAA